ncbi:MAG: histidine kinase, partial [Clostridiales bacterium]|nr:histidine kinase [Clostridiales bacterium]
FRNTLIDQAIVDHQNAIVQSAANLDNVVNELDQVALYLCADKMIPQLLESTPNSMVDRMNLPEEIKSRFAVYTNVPITASPIYYYSMLFISDQYSIYNQLSPYQIGGPYRTMVNVHNDKFVSEADWYIETVKLNNSLNSFRLNEDDGMIYFSKLLKNINFQQSTHSDVVGVMVMGIKSNIIKKMLNAAKTTSDTEFIWLYNDSVIESTIDSKIDSLSKIPEKYEGIMKLRADNRLHEMNIDEETYLVSRTPMSWKFELVTIIPQTNINQKLKDMTMLMIIQAFVVIAFGMGILYFLTSKYTKPIISLANTMEEVNDEMQITKMNVNVPTGDEIGILYSSYHRMLNRIHTLITQIKESLNREHKAELRALQAQINPHFIYNTLDSINWVALCEKQDNISVMVTSLSDILRYSISDPNSMVKLREELLNLSKYVQIQRLCNKDKFVFTADVSQELWEILVPKLILQPLVENAIFHASNSTNFIHIKLSAEIHGSTLKITVTDNGTNGNPDDINDYLEGSSFHQSTRGKIGIKNVNDRIKMQFGSEYGLSYTRQEGSGISATITIPFSCQT